MLHRAKHGLITAKLGWTNSWMHLPLPLLLRLSISLTNSLFIPSSLLGPRVCVKCHGTLTASPILSYFPLSSPLLSSLLLFPALFSSPLSSPQYFCCYISQDSYSHVSGIHVCVCMLVCVYLSLTLCVCVRALGCIVRVCDLELPWRICCQCL